jgi:hypothetical protein
MEKEKKKKEKVIYYDDGSTISDMSNVKGSKKKENIYANSYTYTTSATFKEKAHTFFAAMKMMIVPCIIALFVLSVLFMFFFMLAK